MHQQIEKSQHSTKAEERKYWHGVQLVLLQLEGLYHGYLDVVKAQQSKGTWSKDAHVLTHEDFFVLQLDGDVCYKNNKSNTTKKLAN